MKNFMENLAVRFFFSEQLSTMELAIAGTCCCDVSGKREG